VIAGGGLLVAWIAASTPDCAVAMADLLVQAAVVRMQGSHRASVPRGSGMHRERWLTATMYSASRSRHLGEQRLRNRQCLAKWPCLASARARSISPERYGDGTVALLP